MGTKLEEPLLRVDSLACLTGNLSWLLAQAHYLIAGELHAAFGSLGISPRGYSVLAAAQGAERTQTELAATVGLDKTTMVVTLDELEQAGLAERRPAPRDRRARVVAVTEAGAAKVEEARKVVDCVQSEALESLPEEERRALVGALTRLVQEGSGSSPGIRRRDPR